MIFNRWRNYPKKRPRKSGWYLCATVLPDDAYSEIPERHTNKLFYIKEQDIWKDHFGKIVFDDCVAAWKKISKRGKKK